MCLRRSVCMPVPPIARSLRGSLGLVVAPALPKGQSQSQCLVVGLGLLLVVWGLVVASLSLPLSLLSGIGSLWGRLQAV